MIGLWIAMWMTAHGPANPDYPEWPRWAADNEAFYGDIPISWWPGLQLCRPISGAALVQDDDAWRLDQECQSYEWGFRADGVVVWRSKPKEPAHGR